MNKRIRKKKEIRRCEKSREEMIKLLCPEGDGCSPEVNRAWKKGLEIMYAHRIAAIRKRYRSRQSSRNDLREAAAYE